MQNKTIFVTGASGFIGANLCKKILQENDNIQVVGLDNMNDYYDVSLKEERLNILNQYDNFTFIKGDLIDKNLIMEIFSEYKPNIVVNLAAQAGVRYSIENPDVYIKSNIIGFFNILEACKTYSVEHLVYASSSSVYGLNDNIPYSINDNTDQPVSLYGATKKCDEVMAYSYSKLYNIPTTGIRFFTVYGPLGRPDMAYFKFTNKLINKEEIQIYNYGNCERDFTYIDDAIEGMYRIISNGFKNHVELQVPYKIYNIGNNHPEKIIDFINILQEELLEAEILSQDYDFEKLKKYLPMQQGDVYKTYADTKELEKDYGFKPHTPLKKGLKKFVNWYKDFYL